MWNFTGEGWLHFEGLPASGDFLARLGEGDALRDLLDLARTLADSDEEALAFNRGCEMSIVLTQRSMLTVSD